MELGLHQRQQLSLTQEMQQALQILQMPLLDLQILIEHELQENPLLETEEIEPSEPEEDDLLPELDENFTEFLTQIEIPDTSIPDPVTLADVLMQQAHDADLDPALAEAIIGNLDEDGLLATPLSEIPGDPVQLAHTLDTIQTFAPAGVGARTRQESLLLQLEPNTPAYILIEKHYEDLLHNRRSKICRAMRLTADQLDQIIALAPLNFHPGASFDRTPNPTIIPDIIIREEEGTLRAEVTSLPNLRLNMLSFAEAKEYIRKRAAEAQWLMRNIFQRGETLHRLADAIIEIQGDYFLGGRLAPLTQEKLANHLGLHPSTIARAVANKFIATPRGTMPLRSLFSTAYTTSGGRTFSAHAVRDIIADIITNESKPLSDQAISDLLATRGISCARRTVAKYRKEMDIPDSRSR